MKCDTIADLEKFLKIQEQALGASTPEVATTASKLADLYLKAGKLKEAEALLIRVLEIRENLVGFHQDDIEGTKQSLEHIAELKSGKPQRKIDTKTESHSKEKETEKETAPKFATANSKDAAAPEYATKTGAPELTDYARVNNIKGLNDAMKEAEIEVELLRQMVGPDHPSVADLLTKLADVYCRMRMYARMEPVLVEALKIREAACGENHVSVSTELKNLARLYLVQERYALAEPLFKRALAIREKAYGKMHPRVADIEEQYAQLLRKTNRSYLAETLDQHVDQIRNQHFGDSSVSRKTSMFNRGL